MLHHSDSGPVFLHDDGGCWSFIQQSFVSIRSIVLFTSEDVVVVVVVAVNADVSRQEIFWQVSDRLIISAVLVSNNQITMPSRVASSHTSHWYKWRSVINIVYRFFSWLLRFVLLWRVKASCFHANCSFCTRWRFNSWDQYLHLEPAAARIPDSDEKGKNKHLPLIKITARCSSSSCVLPLVMVVH